ncbi:MAG: NAD(P)-dependent oxidoreductase [Deltaproteobacteria bacterium]|jgi:3-hydroxyisobutyrate dehydrogenase|nr:NAD(P)-dependent oxidoreductase [Deltaproteobacteria bacterium]
MKVGFIGLGAMGRPMAKRLQNAGFDLFVHDLMPEAVGEMVSLGSVAKDNPAQIACEAEIICSSLPNSAILMEVATGKNGILSTMRPGTLLIDFSSVEPHLSRRLAEAVEAKGASMLDAPVSGGTAGAANGALTIMVGGRAEDLDKAMIILKQLGKKIIHVGDNGQGQAMKLVNNLLLGINMAAAAEALTLGRKLGLNPKIMLDTIAQSSGASYALTAKAEKFIFPGKFAPGFAVDLQYKDLELAVNAAKNLTVPLPMGNQAQQIFEVARAKDLGREDISSVVKLYEEAAKTKVRTQS